MKNTTTTDTSIERAMAALEAAGLAFAEVERCDGPVCAACGVVVNAGLPSAA